MCGADVRNDDTRDLFKTFKKSDRHRDGMGCVYCGPEACLNGHVTSALISQLAGFRRLAGCVASSAPDCADVCRAANRLMTGKKKM